MRIASLVLALGMIAPTKAKARARSEAITPPPRTPERQSRRSRGRIAASIAPQRSPCGRHVFEIEDGAVLLDGRRVSLSPGAVHVLGAPIWREDGEAVAWLERGGGETRLVVVPEISSGPESLAWALPRALGSERVHWASSNRVVLGPQSLQPRAVASWTESPIR